MAEAEAVEAAAAAMAKVVVVTVVAALAAEAAGEAEVAKAVAPVMAKNAPPTREPATRQTRYRTIDARLVLASSCVLLSWHPSCIAWPVFAPFACFSNRSSSTLRTCL